MSASLRIASVALAVTLGFGIPAVGAASGSSALNTPRTSGSGAGWDSVRAAGTSDGAGWDTVPGTPPDGAGWDGTPTTASTTA